MKVKQRSVLWDRVRHGIDRRQLGGRRSHFVSSVGDTISPRTQAFALFVESIKNAGHRSAERVHGTIRQVDGVLDGADTLQYVESDPPIAGNNESPKPQATRGKDPPQASYTPVAGSTTPTATRTKLAIACNVGDIFHLHFCFLVSFLFLQPRSQVFRVSLVTKL